MHDGANIVLRKDGVQTVAVPDIPVDQRGGATGQLANALNDSLVTVAQVIQHNHVVPGLEQGDTGMATYVTGTTCDKYATRHREGFLEASRSAFGGSITDA